MSKCDLKSKIMEKQKTVATQTDEIDLIDLLLKDLEDDATPMQRFHKDVCMAMTLDSDGNLPIHRSVIEEDIKVLHRQCLALKALRIGINVRNIENKTPLEVAILHDVDVNIILLLLHHGIDVTTTDNDGNTPLHYAILYERLELLRILLANIDDEGVVNAYNYEGLTPLLVGVIEGHTAIVSCLLSHQGVDVNAQDKKSGRTALFHAAEQNNEEMVKLLLENGGDTKIRNFLGTNTHDAMFEMEVNKTIRAMILGKNTKNLNKSRKSTNKKRKLEESDDDD